MALSDELRVKGRCGVLAGKTMWSTPERLRGEVLTTRRYTNLGLPLPLPLLQIHQNNRKIWKLCMSISIARIYDWWWVVVCRLPMLTQLKLVLSAYCTFVFLFFQFSDWKVLRPRTPSSCAHVYISEENDKFRQSLSTPRGTWIHPICCPYRSFLRPTFATLLIHAVHSDDRRVRIFKLYCDFAICTPFSSNYVAPPSSGHLGRLLQQPIWPPVASPTHELFRNEPQSRLIWSPRWSQPPLYSCSILPPLTIVLRHKVPKTNSS